MEVKAKSLRPFLGAKDFMVSRRFYTDLGFSETVLWQGFSLFTVGNFAFYLQDGYVKEWVDNTQIFLEVENLPQFWQDLSALGLPSKYRDVRIVPIREEHWGRECFVHDPSGILWHFGEFV